MTATQVITEVIKESRPVNDHGGSLSTTSQIPESQTLRDSVEKSMNNYFAHLDGQDVTDVYQMVLSEVEAPLLETVMAYVKGNQTRAATLLGLNRGTLRKKLKQYGLL
ncbi:DNA-binding transcriptional regulator Fis [Endozoicomonas sp.]|uniref:DNA-binding transcriptional regulator Fis n=1 Tax=Endozoicomonas sp. TaxID=1892382 RepID=UPI00383BBA3C